tara:strand:+ start:2544 stop:3422 length:879 start_codon:yes stop_codon:yes gene_type:complete
MAPFAAAILLSVLCVSVSATPAGFTTFFKGGSCPANWTEVKDAKGRLGSICRNYPKLVLFTIYAISCYLILIFTSFILLLHPRIVVSVDDGTVQGITVNNPLANLEDRTHTHTISENIHLDVKSISAIGCCNPDGACNGDYAVTGKTTAEESGLPFAQLILCSLDIDTEGCLRSLMKDNDFSCSLSSSLIILSSPIESNYQAHSSSDFLLEWLLSLSERVRKSEMHLYWLPSPPKSSYCCRRRTLWNDCLLLSWTDKVMRRPQWMVFPDDHIGMLEICEGICSYDSLLESHE